MKKLFCLICCLLVSPAWATEPLQLARADATSQAMDFAQGLVPALTESLGVSETQASGGLGSLFGLAKDNLGKEDFASLAELVPDMDQLLKAAPALSGDSSDALGSLMGDKAKALTGAKAVYDQFSELGLGTEHIAKYAEIVQGYLQSEGGQSAVDLFQQGVGSLLSGG